MKFDVIIGNPPYQLNDGGGMGTSAVPLYQKFIEQALKLNPQFLSMIIPARWYAGGKGLDEFRDMMLNDRRISHIVDYFDSSICFPRVDISGGICYFLWNKDHQGDCTVRNVSRDESGSLMRPLLELNTKTFIRFNGAISILRKVQKLNEESLSKVISTRKPFGFSKPSPITKGDYNEECVKVYTYPEHVYMKISEVTKNKHAVNEYKVFIAKAYGERGRLPYNVIAKPFIGEPNSCCSETYLMISVNNDLTQAKNLLSYISTKFFRFLVLLKKNTQNAPCGVYEFVPSLDLSEAWTDEKLFKRYSINEKEIEYIDKLVKPMEVST